MSSIIQCFRLSRFSVFKLTFVTVSPSLYFISKPFNLSYFLEKDMRYVDHRVISNRKRSIFVGFITKCEGRSVISIFQSRHPSLATHWTTDWLRHFHTSTLPPTCFKIRNAKYPSANPTPDGASFNVLAHLVSNYAIVFSKTINESRNFLNTKTAQVYINYTNTNNAFA